MEKKDLRPYFEGCPTGEKVFSPVCGDCEFVNVTERGNITIFKRKDEKNVSSYSFKADGCLTEASDAEPLLFPSKDVRDWGAFRAKYVMGDHTIDANLREKLEDNGCIDPDAFGGLKDGLIYYIDRGNGRLRCVNKEYEATRPLYEYLLAHGLNLAGDTRKYSVGDFIVIEGGNGRWMGKVVKLYDNGNVDVFNGRCLTKNIFAERVKGVATDEDIDQWNMDALAADRIHYSKSGKGYKRWLFPGDPVCVRNDERDDWRYCQFSHYNKNPYEKKPYICSYGSWKYCVPFNSETIGLIGTAKGYEGKYVLNRVLTVEE